MSSYYEKMLATGEVKCIDEEIPFEIPKGWEWCRLSAVSCSIVDGDHMPPPKSFQGIPFIVISNIAMGYLDLNTSRYVPESYFRTLSQERVPQVGDILFSVTGSYGIAVRINTNCNFCFQRHIALIRPMSINSEYLEFLLNSAFIKKQCDTVATGMAQKTVGIDSLRKLIIPIPPIREQSSIVAKSKLLMPLVRKYSIMQEKLDRLDANIKNRLYNSILQDAIKGWPTCPKLYKFCHRDSRDNGIVLLEQIKTEKQKLVEEGNLKKSALNNSTIFRDADNRYYEKIGKKCVDITEEIPFSIPANWTWVRIRDVFRLNPKNEADDDSMAAFVPMEKIRAGYKSDFTFDLVKWGNIKKGFTHFANGDVAFAKITPCFQNRKSAIFHDLPNGIGAGTTELKVLRPYGNTIGRWYLLYFLESPYFIDEATFKGTANQQRIVVGYLENKLFPLPPKEEQQRIVAQIEKLFEQLH